MYGWRASCAVDLIVRALAIVRHIECGLYNLTTVKVKTTVRGSSRTLPGGDDCLYT